MIQGIRSLKLDALRGLSAIVVVACHVVEVYWTPIVGLEHWSALLASTVSLYAVGAFFFLSGVMITESIFKHSRAGVFVWRDYAIARLSRIYPPLVFAMILTTIVIAAMNAAGLSQNLVAGESGFVARRAADVHTSIPEALGTLSLSYRILLPHEAFMRLDGPLWTLSSEAWLYVLAALAAVSMSTAKARPLVAAAAIAAGAGIVAAIDLLQVPASFRDFLAFAAVWCSGSAFRIVLRRGDAAAARYVFGLAAIGAALLALLALRYPASFALRPFETAHGHVGFVAGMALVSALAAGWILGRRAAPPKVIAATADFSYTLYLTHFPLLILAYAVSPSPVSAAAAFACAVTLSKYGATWIEKRSRAGTRRALQRLTRPAAVMTGRD